MSSSVIPSYVFHDELGHRSLETCEPSCESGYLRVDVGGAGFTFVVRRHDVQRVSRARLRALGVDREPCGRD